MLRIVWPLLRRSRGRGPRTGRLIALARLLVLRAWLPATLPVALEWRTALQARRIAPRRW
jgi:hypothetical protein